MKFTLSWLKDHLDTRASLEQITSTLTKIGLEVESVADPGKALKDFIIASVVSAEKHPNADRLKLCMVDIGEGAPLQVVCGAPNARAGMKGVFAKPGTYIPGKDMMLQTGVIRGVESRGMLCSGAELQLSEESDGILDLPADAPVGASYADYAKLEDAVIEIALTPNRPDCAGVLGIARDLAAAGLGELKSEKLLPMKGNFPCPISLKIDLGSNPQLCPAFAMRLIKDVKNTQSPEWLQQRLKAIGLRPISALVDITNYLTFDRARPLHVFDADKVKGALTVRRAAKGESFKALDGKTYTLDETMCVIADDEGVESLAGIIGGENTSCNEMTKNVLIECALWDPANIAQTGRKLGIKSDARYRNERGLDSQSTMPGLELATKLALEFCSGQASEIIMHDNISENTHPIHFPSTEVKRLTGADIPHQEAKIILKSLGFWLSGSEEEWHVAPPSWRPDVKVKADLVEEVIRIAGFERLKSTPLLRAGKVSAPVLTLLQKRRNTAQRALGVRGFTEAITWSFIPQKKAAMFGGGQEALNILNPISVEMASMRPSLLAGLIAGAKQNMDKGYSDLALFEVGQVFTGEKPEEQKWLASGVRSNLAKTTGAGRNWLIKENPADAFDVKADCLATLAALGAPETMLITRDAPPWFHPGRSGTMRLGPIVIANFGELHPQILADYDITGRLAAFEIFLEALPTPKAKITRTKPKLQLSTLQPVHRDFAFIVDEKIDAAELLKAARSAEKTLIGKIGVFDVYQGRGIESGKKSIAIEVTLQPQDKTMTDAEIEEISQKIVAAVIKATGASLRA
jgi:phenylalanyl-tRNA synthetase beta chain